MGPRANEFARGPLGAGSYRIDAGDGIWVCGVSGACADVGVSPRYLSGRAGDLLWYREGGGTGDLDALVLHRSYRSDDSYTTTATPCSRPNHFHTIPCVGERATFWSMAARLVGRQAAGWLALHWPTTRYL